MTDIALFVLRLTVGTLLAGHGSQKLFGWFKGPGLKGTHGFMESLGMPPGKVWGTMAGVAEFSGGALTALGFLNPLGPLNIMAAMTVAIRRVHWGKPIWTSEGGAELPLTNLTVATAVMFAGPGRYSLDRMLGIRIPRWMAVLATLATAATTFVALTRPEMAQALLGKASPAPANSSPSANDSQVEVETRPRSESAKQSPAQV